MRSKEKYVPALGSTRLTGLYDPLCKWLMQEERFKRALVEQLGVMPNQTVLDVGSGTGTLTVMLKERYPFSQLYGLDGDDAVLMIAQGKSERTNVEINWTRGFAFDLPFADASFDYVVSSLVFHHLTSENKLRAAREMCRVLKTNGAVYLADLDQPQTLPAKIAGLIIQHMEHADDNIHGLVPEIFARAGFPHRREMQTFDTIVGRLQILRIQK